MGSAAALQLATRGVSVIGLEAFWPGHDRGSSHGESRIIRQAYFEDPSYVPLVQRAYQLWRELEAISGERLLDVTGGLMIGSPDGEMVKGALESAQRWDLPYRVLSSRDLAAEHPVFDPSEKLVAVHEPDAGVLAPELAVLTQIREAIRRGAHLYFGETVEGWEEAGDGVVVRTSTGRFEADRLVLTAGAWTQRILGDFQIPLAVERQVMAWFAPADIGPFTAPRCPVYLFDRPAGGTYYGFPTRDGRTAKVARHHGGELTQPDEVDREVADADILGLRTSLAEIVPALAVAPVERAKVCIYTNTPDRNFAIGALSERVVLASGFSGHGFKFAPVVGEILADLVESASTRHDIQLLSLDRFPEFTRASTDGAVGSSDSVTSQTT
jgi:sarcosine oxidase